jgi:hypothetical protein
VRPGRSCVQRRYAVAGGHTEKGPIVKLTGHIKRAAGGRVELEVDQIPGLEAHAQNVEDIPNAIRIAAGAWTGKPGPEFEVEVRY